MRSTAIPNTAPGNNQRRREARPPKAIPMWPPDALPSLRASLAARRAPYEMNWNGHPNPEGDDAIARAVVESSMVMAISADGTPPAEDR